MKIRFSPKDGLFIFGRVQKPWVEVKHNRKTSGIRWSIGGLDNQSEMHTWFNKLIDHKEFFDSLHILALSYGCERDGYIQGSVCWGSGRKLGPKAADAIAAEILSRYEKAMEVVRQRQPEMS